VKFLCGGALDAPPLAALVAAAVSPLLSGQLGERKIINTNNSNRKVPNPMGKGV
jgi:hypothetical protein